MVAAYSGVDLIEEDHSVFFGDAFAQGPEEAECLNKSLLITT
jgi:hypothetical protein